MNEDRFVTLPSGVELCYQDRGEGEPLMLIMGLGYQLIHWPEELLTALQNDGYRVIVFDNRDAGRSSRLTGRPPSFMEKLKRIAPEGAYTVEDMAEDAFGLLDHLGLDQAHLVGMSLGGMIAQAMSSHKPDRVKSLTSIFSTTGASKVGYPGLRMLIQLSKKAARTREAFIDRGMETISIIQGRDYRSDKDDKRALFGAAWDRGGNDQHRGIARQMNAVFASGDRTAALAAITAPTLVIHGDRDPLVHPSGGVATAKAISGAELVTVKGMGHELPASLVPKLRELITGHIRTALAA